MATFFLAESDINTLKDVIRWYKQRELNLTGVVIKKDGRPGTGDVYLARIPDESTLEAYNTSSETPGVLDCDVYQPGGETGNQSPQKMGFKEKILNFTTSTFESGTFAVVSREKFGRWVVGGGAGATTAEVNVCEKLNEFPEGDVDADTKFVSINQSGDCQLVSQALDICGTLGTFTIEEHDEDVLLIGRDTATDTCHRYDVFSQIQALRDDICRLAAIVEQLVDEAAIGSNEICP